MCGIAGIIGLKSVDQSEIKSITNALKHRGPDAQGILLDVRAKLPLAIHG